MGTVGPWGMSGVALPPAPQPIPWRGEGGLQLGETQGDPNMPGPRTDGAAAGVGDGRWLSAPWAPRGNEEKNRSEMSLGKWCPAGVHSPMFQPDQGPHLVGARSLGRVGAASPTRGSPIWLERSGLPLSPRTGSIVGQGDLREEGGPACRTLEFHKPRICMPGHNTRTTPVTSRSPS